MLISTSSIASLSAWLTIELKFQIAEVEFYFNIKIIPTTLIDGSQGVTLVMEDITERKSMEEELRESEAETLALSTAIPDLMFQIGKDSTFLDFKPAKEFLTALPPSEFLGKKVHEVMPTEFAQQVMHYVKRTLQTGDTQIFEYQLPVPLQSRNMRDYEARIVGHR